jgi:capsular polysaccharide biosynthesis protein
MNTDLNNFWRNINKNWSNLIIIILFVVILTAIFTFSQPLKYESSAKLLVVQEYNAEVDPYAASRSTQYLSSLLTKVVESTSFFEEVLKTGFNIDDNFGSNSGKRIKNWNKTVKADAISDSGIIIVNVYHESSKQAEQIAQAVSYVMKSKHSLYHGWGNKVSLRTIERPINSQWPVKPNIIFNLIFSVIFGIIFGVGFIYLFPDAKIRLWPKKKKRNNNKKQIENNIENSRLEDEDSVQAIKDNWSHLGEVIEKKQDQDIPQEKTIDDLVEKVEEVHDDENREDRYNSGDMGQFDLR